MTTMALPERPPVRRFRLPLHTKFVAVELRKALVSVALMALFLGGVVLLLWILSAIPMVRDFLIHLDLGGVEELPLPLAISVTVLLAAAAGTVLAQFVGGIMAGSLTRSYLGSGMTRKDIAGSWIAVGGISSLITSAVATVLGYIMVIILQSNVDETGAFDRLDSSGIGDAIAGSGSLPPLLAIPLIYGGVALGLWALHTAGYALALVFVRLPFYIPMAAWVLYEVFRIAFRSLSGREFDMPHLPWPTSDNPTLSFFFDMSHFALEVAIVGGIVLWLTMRRLPIRRSAK